LQSKLKCSVAGFGVITATLLLVLMSQESAWAAGGEPSEWCVLAQGPDGGYVSCGYATRAQCLEALSGVGGICHENPDARQPDRHSAGRFHRRDRRE
jgi:hypothetical protein